MELHISEELENRTVSIREAEKICNKLKEYVYDFVSRYQIRFQDTIEDTIEECYVAFYWTDAMGEVISRMESVIAAAKASVSLNKYWNMFLWERGPVFFKNEEWNYMAVLQYQYNSCADVTNTKICENFYEDEKKKRDAFRYSNHEVIHKIEKLANEIKGRISRLDKAYEEGMDMEKVCFHGLFHDLEYVIIDPETEECYLMDSCHTMIYRE